MSKSRILPCENAHNNSGIFMDYAKQKTAKRRFTASIYRQQYLQNSRCFFSICINKQKFHYHLTSVFLIDIIQTVSEKRCTFFDISRKKDLIMATTKKTTAKAETKTAAKKTATKKAEPAAKKVETKAAAKAETKVAAAKAETKAVAEKKPAAKKAPAKKAEPKFDLFIQFGGATVSVADIEKNVKKVVKGKKAYTVYVKPEESKAYIVADGETTGMDVFFVAD